MPNLSGDGSGNHRCASISRFDGLQLTPVERVGEATGSASQQIKGGAKQVEGKIQQGVGDAKESLKETDRETR